MATSGSIDFSQTMSDIISDAFTLLGVYGAQESISGVDSALASRTLNAMVKAWQARGINLFTLTEGTVFLEDGQYKYTLNGSSGDQAANETEVVETTLDADAASGAATVTCSTVTGMTAGDVIGVVLDDDTIDWDTISSIDTGTDVVTLTGTLSGAATDGNRVYTYTNLLNRPLDIVDVRLRDDDDQDRQLTKISREEYFALSDKDSSGTVNLYYYDRQASSGYLYVWPAPSDSNTRLKITYVRTIEDFDSNANNPDFPQEWVEAIKYQLAVRLAPAFGKDAKLQTLGPLASSMLENMLEWDNEHASLFLHPDNRD